MRRLEIKGNAFTILLYRLILVLALLSLSRLFLYFFNVDYFNSLNTKELVSVFSIGLRFDTAVLMMLNAPFIMISAFPFDFKQKLKTQNVILYITLFLNSLALGFNIIDSIYFRFTLKRSTFDLFNFIDANVGLFDLFKALIFDYWYMALLAITMILFLIYSWLIFKVKPRKTKKTKYQLFFHSLGYIFILGLIVLGMRGGIQLKPLNLIDAGRMVSSNQIPLVLNTPFSLIVTRNQQKLEAISWFSDEDARAYFNTIHSYKKDTEQIKNKNIVILILESFSSSKIGYFNNQQKSLTPFLDRLLAHSLTFKGIANGKKSIEGIPAILSSIPNLIRQPFLTSIYASNEFSSIASILKPYQYTSAFFHGGKNGTMNLNSYTKRAGFDHYYGMSEYENKADYDGSWGIWDHKFYPFFNTKLKEMKAPFVAAFFSLSSHHPYAIPQEFESVFTNDQALDNAIAYADFALAEFFETAKKEDWFENTLFVITADHTAELPNTTDSSSRAYFEIPIAFYAPNDSLLANKTHRNIVQHSDILPSILDYLAIPDPFHAFGNSVFDSTAPNFALYYLNETYHIVNANRIFEFDGDQFLYQTNYESEIDTDERSRQEKQVKSLIQQYTLQMINNKLSLSEQK